MRSLLRGLASLVPSFVLAAGCGLSGVSCAGDLDTTRQASEGKTTLGEDVFTLLCDRVGASSFPEDLSGGSYHPVCHKQGGAFPASKVDVSRLPPPAAPDAQARQRSIAKVEAMARRRGELIEAFDALLPDVSIDDPFHPGDASRRVRLHDALTTLAQRLTPLYESSPYAARLGGDPPLLPAVTRSAARLLDALSASPPAQKALAHIGARQGYRPGGAGLGAVRSVLAYPGLRSMSRALLDRAGPGGPLEAKFQHLLAVAEQELRTLAPDPPAAPLAVDAAHAQPNRARQKLEILAALLLSEDPAFARDMAAPRFIAARDSRGFAVPAGSQPGQPGAVPAPFADADGDGYADVDLLGRFVDQGGKPLLAAPPFQARGVLFDKSYTFEPGTARALRAGQLVYGYVDTSQTLLRSTLLDFSPLVATQMAPQGALPSSLMKTLEGAFLLYGAPRAGTAAYPRGEGDPVQIDYGGFDAQTSPLVDLAYAAGQLFGAPESDDYLGAVLDLHAQHPEKTARALSLAWSIWSKSKDPAYAQASLADSATFWDDMADWLARVSRVDASHAISTPPGGTARGLLPDLTLALGHPDAVKYLPEAFSAPFVHADHLSYDPDDISGPPLNLEAKAPTSEAVSFSRPVDRSQPAEGNNRSAFQRFARMIDAANHVNACNKAQALVKSDLSICGLTIPLTYPIKVPIIGQQSYIDECKLFQIDDLGVFFIDSVLPWDHPRRARLKIEDQTLSSIVDAVSKLVPGFCGDLNMDAILQGSTGIRGLTRIPTPEALTRLVFFGAEAFALDGGGNPVAKYGALPDLDPYFQSKNAALNTFVSNSLDLVGTNATYPDGSPRCPKDALGVNVCKSYGDTLRGLDPGTFFVAETPYLAKHPDSCHGVCSGLPAGTSDEKHDQALCHAECDGPSSGFYEGIRPMLTAFASYAYDPDPGEGCTRDSQGRCSGEQLFINLIGILSRHWGSDGSALNRYEELLAWVMTQSNLLGTAADLSVAMRDQPYASLRVKSGAPRSGLDVTRSLVGFLFDPRVAQSLGLTDRSNSAQTTRNDGSPKAQTTPYDLFVHALRGFDAAFDQRGDPDKKARWKQARSELVDQFLLADPGAWKNPAIARALPVVGQLVREQINANCPDRESSGQCHWARIELSQKLGAVIEGPLFAAISDVQEALRADPTTRVELEKLLVYLVARADDPDALALTLTSFGDLLQVLHDDQDLAPILNALSPLAAPGLAPQAGGAGAPSKSPGITHETLKLMKVLLDDHEGEKDREETTIDRYHALDPVLRNLVTPPPGDNKLSPLEVMLDAVAEIQRIDSSNQDSLAPEDYKAVADGVRSFLTDPYRGLEQFYAIVRQRDGN